MPCGTVWCTGCSPCREYVLSAGYTEEQRNLKERIPAAEAEIERLEALVADVGRFIERAKRYTEITELTPELLRTFISKVVVHERDVKYSRSVEQKIEIHYAHIGAMEYTANTGLEQFKDFLVVQFAKYPSEQFCRFFQPEKRH